MIDAVIVATARSPIGRAGKGSLREIRPDDLLVQVLKSLLNKLPSLNTSDIEDLIVGCSQPAGESGFNIARIAAVLLGLDSLPGTTVNRYCSSSLQSTRMAMHAIRAGEGDVFISAGVDTSSRFFKGTADGNDATENPKFGYAKERNAELEVGNLMWTDPSLKRLLPDAYIAMGKTAENVASLMGITRNEQDQFAVRSQNLAEEALHNGFWSRDITPIELTNGTFVSTDDCPRPGVTLEAISKLSPVFRNNGTVTAGNCCPLNDGAAAVMIMSEEKARNIGLEPMARIVSTAVSALSPEVMGLGPVEASRKALKQAKMRIEDIDLIEINEAFAAQVIPSARELGIDFDKLNINGGAIAIGHPFGMTGARITSTLINSLQFHDKQFGLETMCVGGGQGMAMILERMS
jgi:acetyl-CoA C-acetyltransferase